MACLGLEADPAATACTAELSTLVENDSSRSRGASHAAASSQRSLTAGDATGSPRRSSSGSDASAREPDSPAPPAQCHPQSPLSAPSLVRPANATSASGDELPAQAVLLPAELSAKAVQHAAQTSPPPGTAAEQTQLLRGTSLPSPLGASGGGLVQPASRSEQAARIECAASSLESSLSPLGVGATSGATREKGDSAGAGLRRLLARVDRTFEKLFFNCNCTTRKEEPLAAPTPVLPFSATEGAFRQGV